MRRIHPSAWLLACAVVARLSNTASFSLPAPVPAVSIVKTLTPASPNPGDVVTYRLVVTNTGNVVLTSVAVTDTVASGFGHHASVVCAVSRNGWPTRTMPGVTLA